MLPSTTDLGTKPMPMRTEDQPFDASHGCVHVQAWTFYSQLGLCPSSNFAAGNYAHSIIDYLAPMFLTLELLRSKVGEPMLPHLLTTQVPDPPHREQRAPSPCEQISRSLGFDPQPILWEDIAVATTKFCFDTLVPTFVVHLGSALSNPWPCFIECAVIGKLACGQPRSPALIAWSKCLMCFRFSITLGICQVIGVNMDLASAGVPCVM